MVEVVTVRFRDRRDAGRQLAARLEHLAGADVLVLGLPRGGLPVAAEVATAVHAPLDVIVVRKLGAPHQRELAMGAVGEDGVRVLDPHIVAMVGATEEQVAAIEERERAEVASRAERFRGGRDRHALEGRTVVIVDDGIATGATARAACQVARTEGAARIVLAVPVAPHGWEERFAGEADELVAVDSPSGFMAVGQYYNDFTQVTDDAVVEILRAARAIDEEVHIPAGPVALDGHLTIPPGAPGVVVFAHGSGSSRHSPRNRMVADHLVRAGLGTLLFDLLTTDEEHDRRNVFDVELLGRRLADTTTWLRARTGDPSLPVAYFGASTGAAAALWAAAEPGAQPACVVSRGGRPDLAADRLPTVTAPTLLLVGGRDDVVLDLNRQAAARMTAPVRIEVVPGATHLFEEPGALDAVADLARDFLVRELAPAARPEGSGDGGQVGSS